MNTLRTWAMTLAFLFVLPGLVVFAQGDDWKEVKKEARGAVRNPDPDVRLKALKRLAGFDSKEALDLMLDFWSISARWKQKYRGERVVRQAELSAMEAARKKKKSGSRMSSDDLKKMGTLRTRIRALAGLLQKEEAILDGVAEAMAGIKSDEAVKLLSSKLRGGDWTLRVAAVDALGKIASEGAVKKLLQALEKEKDGRVQIPIIQALSRKSGGNIQEAILETLKKTKAWQVKVACAKALLRFPGVQSVKALVEALKDAEGRVREDLNQTLVLLTGVNKHGAHGAWNAWVERNEGALADGTYKKPKKKDAQGNLNMTTFYGIPIVSKRVVFILDRSGSMMSPTKWKPGNDVATGAGVGKGPNIQLKGNRRIDVARYELQKAILGLQNDVAFNVIFYDTTFTVFMGGKLIRATEANKKLALAFVEKLEPQGSTNIYDSVEGAFLMGRGIRGRQLDPHKAAFKDGADTIFLMSDGSPNQGKFTRQDDILREVGKMNRSRKIKIHTVAVGTLSPNMIEFMKELAGKNGGKCVHRE